MKKDRFYYLESLQKQTKLPISDIFCGQNENKQVWNWAFSARNSSSFEAWTWAILIDSLFITSIFRRSLANCSFSSLNNFGFCKKNSFDFLQLKLFNQNPSLVVLFHEFFSLWSWVIPFFYQILHSKFVCVLEIHPQYKPLY